MNQRLQHLKNLSLQGSLKQKPREVGPQQENIFLYELGLSLESGCLVKGFRALLEFVVQEVTSLPGAPLLESPPQTIALHIALWVADCSPSPPCKPISHTVTPAALSTTPGGWGSGAAFRRQTWAPVSSPHSYLFSILDKALCLSRPICLPSALWE